MSSFGGTALCDWTAAIRDTLRSQAKPALLVLAFYGNNYTPCMGADSPDLPTIEQGSTEFYARYRSAMEQVTGWEERGSEWRGFSSGGAKTLFSLGANDALRLCVTEAAIDAMSLAAIELSREDSLYVSTGGGWSPITADRIASLAARPGSHLVAACDGNDQGDVYAARLKQIAEQAGAEFIRLWPEAEDWNEQLREIR